MDMIGKHLLIFSTFLFSLRKFRVGFQFTFKYSYMYCIYIYSIHITIYINIVIYACIEFSIYNSKYQVLNKEKQVVQQRSKFLFLYIIINLHVCTIFKVFS